MPHSYRSFHSPAVEYLQAHVPDRETRIIDLGAGDGSFGAMVRPHFPNTDAVEIWAPYVEQFGLERIYRRIRVGRAQDLAPEDIRGSVLVMGDVLEHLEVPEAQAFLRRFWDAGARMLLVIVPWLYEQGPQHPDVLQYGNPHEVHQQPDLTSGVFAVRYPDLTLVGQDAHCGFYVRDRA